MTSAETLLHGKLKERFPDHRFRAQHPVNYFIADFYCHQAKLIIEVDGNVHDSTDQLEYDANRTYLLEEFGLTVIRFRNEEIDHSIESVLIKIDHFLRNINCNSESM